MGGRRPEIIDHQRGPGPLFSIGLSIPLPRRRPSCGPATSLLDLPGQIWAATIQNRKKTKFRLQNLPACPGNSGLPGRSAGLLTPAVPSASGELASLGGISQPRGN